MRALSTSVFLFVAGSALAQTGTIDLGYRWRTEPTGNFNAYRSMVNLGEGPKLFGADVAFVPKSKKLFDHVSLSGIGWGGDPQTTARLEVTKEGAYRFNFDYRNMAYFDALPSFATPLSGRGIYLNERSYDTRRKLADFSLELRPGSRVIPFLQYTRNSDSGSGVMNFISDANEYPVRNLLNSHSDHIRGGVRLDLTRVHVTLEQGHIGFIDGQQLRDDTRVNGNNSTPLLGQTLFLGSLRQSYDVNGSTPYSRAVFTATPVKWADFFGQFQFSQGQTDVKYQQSATGSFVDLKTLLFYTSEQNLFAGMAKQPHTSGSVGGEFRPFERLRIIENWTTDRLHTSGDLIDNYNQHSLDVIFDLTSKLTLRGGHRYVYGDTTVRAPFAGGVESGVLDRQSATAGAGFRSGGKISANFDFEGGSSDRTYYRTSLQNYRKYRARARYQVLQSLLMTWNFTDLENENPIPDVAYDFTSRINTVSMMWVPQKEKRWMLSGDYSRSNVKSSIQYLVPQIYQPAQSLYRENAHEASAVLDIFLPSVRGVIAHVSAGGTLYAGSGSRSTEFYHPNARLSVPFTKKVEWYGEWRWYGLSEPLIPYEGFAANLVSLGLRLRR